MITLGMLSIFFVFGLAFGSFGGMAAYRIPRDLPLGAVEKSRSFCPNCKKKVAWYDNIPVISYLILGGKCRKCKKPISIRYPIIELFVALAFVFVAKIYNWSPDLDLRTQIMFFVDLYFFWSLVVLTFVDLEFRIIPDRFSLGNWGLAIAVVLFNYVKFDTPLWDPLLGGAFGFGLFFLIGYLYEKWKGVEGLGFGDIKMMGWLGTWLGLMGMPMLILVGSLTGLIVGVAVMIKDKGDLKTAIPFGPFLAMGAVAVWTLERMQISLMIFDR